MTANIITTVTRPERAENITIQFGNKSNFQLKVYSSVPSKIGFDDLMEKMKKAVRNNYQDSHILIVEDDHVFSSTYTSAKLNKIIDEGAKNNFDVLLGGVSFATGMYRVPGTSSIIGIKNFRGTQFTILYKRFYDEFLNIDHAAWSAEGYISMHGMVKKGVAIPFVSYQMNSFSHFYRGDKQETVFRDVEKELIDWTASTESGPINK